LIQVKNTWGRGVAIRSRCMIAVATSAAAAAAIAFPALDASSHAPSWRSARTGMLNSHRHARMPAQRYQRRDDRRRRAARPQLSRV
jgi:hypothetical protein